MIDIHNHSLFDIDDGVGTLIEALEMLEKAKMEGVDEIIFTPHYVLDGSYYACKDVVIERMSMLEEKANSLGITMHVGHELFIHNDLCEHLKKGLCCSLANSKYILVEFPFDYYSDDYDYILEDLRSLGYRIIIAHPERYQYVRKDLNFCLRWLDCGDLLQCNQNSFLRKEMQKMMQKMIKHGFISFIASDTHGKQRPNRLSEVYLLLEKQYGKEVVDDLFYKHPKAVIANEEISNDLYQPIKKFFW